MMLFVVPVEGPRRFRCARPALRGKILKKNLKFFKHRCGVWSDNVLELKNI